MNKSIITFFVLIFILLAGCESILEVEPTDYISGEEAIKDKRGVETALIGVYDALQSTGCYGRHLPIIPDIVADNLSWEGTTQDYGQFLNNSILAENLIVESIWNAHYDLLNRLNNVLLKLPDINDMTEAEKDNVEGQLLFIRALCHFNLVRLYGPVPVKTSPTLALTGDLNAARDPVDAAYNQIKLDLYNANGKIANTNPGFATNGAVKALLAKVHLTLEEYAEAKEMADHVINNYQYELETEYNNLFEDVSSEAIFVILFNEQDGNRLAEYYYPTAVGGRYEIAPNEDLLNSFEDGDVRLDATIQGNPVYGYKYRDLITRANNFYVIRLADMYLTRAEAEANLNGVIEDIQADINTIRMRASIGETSANDYETLLEAIALERRNEFALEGHRWFDLLRTDKAFQAKETITNTDQLLFPIPLAETLNNTNPGMYQNKGY